MSQITKPMLLDETGKQILQALRDIAARTNVDPNELKALEERITALEGSTGGTGILYIYGSLKKQQGSAYILANYYAENEDDSVFNFTFDGKPVPFSQSFFNDACTYIALDGNGDGAGVYVYIYEGTFGITGRETYVEICANGEWISEYSHPNGTAYFTAPETVHIVAEEV